MICKCPNCSGALKYEPTAKKMFCEYCVSYFEPGEGMVDPEEKEELAKEEMAAAVSGNLALDEDIGDYMECNVYACTSCGGELLVNGLETSTFCAYCGQPTIVFNRVSRELKPQYILPFSVTKNQAIEAIREKLNQGLFVPEEIKEFETERIRGIYIPYWLCDVDYEDRQSLKGTVGSGKNERTYYYYRKARASFTNMTLDASYRLNDETSQRLEPFNTGELKPFDVQYMSGYYADRYDVERGQIEGVALGRAKTLFDQEVVKSVSANDVKLLKNAPKAMMTDAKYVLLPVWFLTFQYCNEPYTFLVNGQTRKVVGGVPYEKKKVFPLLVALSVLLSALAAFLIGVLLQSEDGDAYKLIFGMVILSLGALSCGLSNFEKVKHSVELTKSRVMMQFVKDRQREG